MKSSNKYFSHEHLSKEERLKLMKKKYDSSNFITKSLISNFYKNIFNILNERLEGDSKVLEVGCGAGDSSLKIYDFVKKISDKIHFEASEFDERFIQVINESNLPFDVIQESVYELKRDDNSFDFILLLEVLEHLEDVELAIKEIARVSKGYFIISVPNEPMWRILNISRFKYLKDFGNTPGHINHFSAKKLKKTISNFAQVVYVKKSLPWLIILAKVK